MHVQINQPGRHHQAPRVNDLRSIGPLGHKLPTGNVNLPDLVPPARRVDHPPVFDNQTLHQIILRVSASPREIIPAPPPPTAQVKHRHAHRQPVRHLLQNHAVRTIRHPAVDLDPPVDRARMHHQTPRLQPLRPRLRQPEQRRVFTQTREIFLPLPLVLNPQQIDHVRRLQHVLDPVRHPHSQSLQLPRHQRRRPDQRDFRPQLHQRLHVRPRHPTEQDIPHDRHPLPSQLAQLLPHRERIQQPLRRMLVRPVARVDHPGPQPLRQELRRPRRLVPDHDHVRVQGLQDHRRILERLALLQARRRGAHVHHVGTHPHGRQFERNPRPRARLHEKIHERLASQRRHLLQISFANPLESLRGVQNQPDLVRRQRVERHQILPRPCHLAHDRTTFTLSGSPSKVSNLTRIFSDVSVGTFFPT